MIFLIKRSTNFCDFLWFRPSLNIRSRGCIFIFILTSGFQDQAPNQTGVVQESVPEESEHFADFRDSGCDVSERFRSWRIRN